MNSVEQFTDIVNKSLDVLGYSKKMVEMRREMYNKRSDLESAIAASLDPTLESYICGSKREGMSGALQSDIDIMTILNNVQCTDTPSQATEGFAYVFELDQSGVLPGYTNLRLVDTAQGKEISYIENSLFNVPSNGLYCSSALFMSEIESGDQELNASSNNFLLTNIMKRKAKTGPSLPVEYKEPLCMFSIDADRVTAFPCECSKYLSSWLGRPRKYEWPTQQLIQMVATLDSHVVPVGAKGSEGDFSQWRICYTHAEVLLMQSLNETHWKLYALLRMLKEEEFQFANDVISSYVLKNLVLWMVESTSEELFRPHLLLDRLTQTVRVLRLCISKAFLPNYMIHERNMLHGRLNAENQTKLLTVLDELILKGRNMVLRCKTLRQNMVVLYKNPSVQASKMSAQNDVEELALTIFSDLPIEHQCEIIRTNWTARTKEEYTAAYMPVLLQVSKSPIYQRYIHAIGLDKPEMLQKGLVNLSNDMPARLKMIQAVCSNKDVFETGIQLLSDPNVAQAVGAMIQSQIVNGTFQDVIEQIPQTLQPLEEYMNNPECNIMELVKSMLAAHPDYFLNIQKQMMVDLAKNSEMCRSVAQGIFSSPEPYMKIAGKVFDVTELQRLMQQHYPEAQLNVIRHLQRR